MPVSPLPKAISDWPSFWKPSKGLSRPSHHPDPSLVSEVKTTTGPKDTDFLISANEVAFSATHPDNYELCRVFAFDLRPNTGRCYSIPGDIAKWLRLSATEYRARVWAAPVR